MAQVSKLYRLFQPNYEHHHSINIKMPISAPQAVFVVQEGDRINNVQVRKFGVTFLSYNVSLLITALRDILGTLQTETKGVLEYCIS